MKKAKSILTMAALAMGLGIGFGVAFTPAQAQAQVNDPALCKKDSDCQFICRPAPLYACLGGLCHCLY